MGKNVDCITKGLISGRDKQNKPLEGGAVEPRVQAPQRGAADLQNEPPAADISSFDKSTIRNLRDVEGGVS